MNVHFSFTTAAFLDSAETRAETVNDIVGHTLATWLSGALKAAGMNASDVWAEDHGWAFSIEHGGARYMCACSLVTEDGPPFEGHVVLAKHRSVWERVTGRNRFAADDAMAAQVLGILKAHTDVMRLEAHQG